MSKMSQLFMEQDCYDEVFAQEDRGLDWEAWMDQMEQDYANAELQILANQ